MISTDLTLTPSAAKRIHAIGAKEGRAVMLRVAVEGADARAFSISSSWSTWSRLTII